VEIAEAGFTRLLDGASQAPPFVLTGVDINAFAYNFAYKPIVSSTASDFTTAIIQGGHSTLVRRMASRILLRGSDLAKSSAMGNYPVPSENAVRHECV
jgi:hypothetical protein